MDQARYLAFTCLVHLSRRAYADSTFKLGSSKHSALYDIVIYHYARRPDVLNVGLGGGDSGSPVRIRVSDSGHNSRAGGSWSWDRCRAGRSSTHAVSLELSIAAKQLLEKRFAYPWGRLTGWLKLKDVLEEFVFQQRCGLHGLRLFGSNKPTSYGSQSLGARLRPLRSPKPTKQQPLNGVLWKLRAWFQNERLHNHEVRTSHITERTIYSLEYERDRQIVLQQQGSPYFQAPILQACTNKLNFLQLKNPAKRQARVFDRIVKPYIGAHARKPQRLSNTPVNLDPSKALLTFASCDRALWLVANGSEEDLSVFVADPKEFISRRKETAIVVIDETAIWSVD